MENQINGESQTQEENIIPDTATWLFGNIQNEEEGDSTIRVYRIVPGQKKFSFCGKFVNEEIDECTIGDKFGIGKYQISLLMHKSKKSFTTTVNIDESFIGSNSNENRSGASLVSSGGVSESLAMIEKLAKIIMPFVMNRPLPQTSNIDQFEGLTKVFITHMSKLQNMVLTNQSAQLKQVIQAPIDNQMQESEGIDIPGLVRMIKPFVTPFLKGLIPAEMVEQTLNNNEDYQEILSKAELFDELAQEMAEQFGEEKAKQVLDKIIRQE